MPAKRIASTKSSAPQQSHPPPAEVQASQGDSEPAVRVLVRAPRRSKHSSWREHWKGLLVLILALQPLVAAALAGAYMNHHVWRDWIQQLTRQGFSNRTAQGGLGSLAPREPTVVYYGPQQLSLGDFSIYVYDPVTRTTLRTDFRVDTTADCEDRQDFEAFVAMYQRLAREQVMVAIRNASLEELTDPQHKLLKRRIVNQVNLMLGKTFLKSVEVKNFSLWESVDHMSFLPYQPPQAQQAAWQSP